MNILHLNTHLNLGGITSYLAVLGPALSKRGHRVHVLSAGGDKAAELEASGIACHTLPIRTKSELNPRLWASLPKAVRLVKEAKIDVIHAHTRVTQVMGAALSRLAGIPMVSTAHGFYKARWGRRMFPCWGERVIAVSSLVADELEESHKVPSEKLRIVTNALDLEAFNVRLRRHDRYDVRRRLGIPEEAFLVGCVSRLVRDKGQEYLIEAASKLPGAHVVIVGDGRELAMLHAKTTRLGLDSRIHFLKGMQDTTELLKAVDAYAHPATYREGFGLVMAEAMLAGVPVVATRIPAINTLFKDGEEALLVEPKDASALAEALSRIRDDQALAQKLIAGGHLLAEGQCRSERQAEEIEAVYKEVVK